MLLLLLLSSVRAIDWLSIHRENSSPEAKSCEKLRNDSERDFGRLKICNQEDPRLIQAVVTAAAQTKNACEVSQTLWSIITLNSEA